MQVSDWPDCPQDEIPTPNGEVKDVGPVRVTSADPAPTTKPLEPEMVNDVAVSSTKSTRKLEDAVLNSDCEALRLTEMVFADKVDCCAAVAIPASLTLNIAEKGSRLVVP